jgi:Ca2+-binding EF-hand superfamily protein
MNFDDFIRFLETINVKLNPEHQRYVFQRIDVDDSNTISYGKLIEELKKYNIPIQSNQRPQLVRMATNNNFYNQNLRDQALIKAANSF